MEGMPGYAHSGVQEQSSPARTHGTKLSSDEDSDSGSDRNGSRSRPALTPTCISLEEGLEYELPPRPRHRQGIAAAPIKLSPSRDAADAQHRAQNDAAASAVAALGRALRAG